MIHYPEHSLSLVGRSDQDPGSDQTSGVQFAVLLPTGEYRVYGNQYCVAFGLVLKDHPDGRVVHRTVTISYGEWVDPTAEMLARARSHLLQCGGYDGCQCPGGDPRSVIADLVAEIERLHGGEK